MHIESCFDLNFDFGSDFSDEPTSQTEIEIITSQADQTNAGNSSVNDSENLEELTLWTF